MKICVKVIFKLFTVFFFVSCNKNLFTTAVYFGCKNYDKCDVYMPKPYYKCDEIEEAWETTFRCLARAKCSGDLYGAGLRIGHCLASYEVYTKIKKCGFSDGQEKSLSFPKSAKELCGINAISEFSIRFTDESRRAKCTSDNYPTSSCDATKMRRFMACIKKVAKTRFTEGAMMGGCKSYTLHGDKCNFDYKTCSFNEITPQYKYSSKNDGTKIGLSFLVMISCIICSVICSLQHSWTNR